MDFHPSHEILSCYLGQVFDRDIYNDIVNGVKRVLNGEVEFIEQDVEWYGAVITREITKIYIVIDEENHHEDCIRTIDFLEALNIWIKEKEKFDMWRQRHHR